MLDNRHWTLKDYKQRCLRKEAQKILLERESINFKGNVYFLKCKSIGAGVYEIYKDLGQNEEKQMDTNY